MAINDMLSAIAQKLGLKTTRLQDLQLLHEKLTDDIRRNQDKLGDLKAKVADLDAKLRAKKKEYDAAGPGIRQIIKREFSVLFKQQEQVLETLDGISGRLEKDVVIIHKLDLLIEASGNPPHTDVSDEIADDLGDVFSDLKDEAESVRNLDAVSYSPGATVSEDRINAIETGEPASAHESSAASSAKEPQDELERMIAAIN